MDPWRIVIVSQYPPVVHGLHALTRAAGHRPVALLFSPGMKGRPLVPRARAMASTLVAESPAELDLLVPASRARIAPLLRAAEPDLVVCIGFGWKVPADALAVPRLGWVNGHPSLLPRYRGPIPIAWAVRNGDSELGLTFHRMDEEFDTGPILAQGSAPLDQDETEETLNAKLGGLSMQLVPRVFERLAAGEKGEPQEGDFPYLGFFDEDYVWIDWSRPALEIHRQVCAWRFAVSPGERGPLTELDGERVRVLRTRLEPGEGREHEAGDGPVWIVETEPA